LKDGRYVVDGVLAITELQNTDGRTVELLDLSGLNGCSTRE